MKPLVIKDEKLTAYLEEHIADPMQNREEVTGMFTFEYFLKLYSAAMIWNRVKFEERKLELVALRRQSLKEDDMDKWREIHHLIRDDDEECLQDVLEEILKIVGITQKEFEKSLNYHMDDPAKTAEIKETQESAQVDRGEGRPNGKPIKRELTIEKKELLALQRTMQKISLE